MFVVSDNHDFIITMEEGVIKGGFGSTILNYYNSKNNKIKVKNLGIEDNFIEHGTREELLDLVNLNEFSLISCIDHFLKE